MFRPAAAMDRLGTESAFEVLARANALAAQGRSILNLGIGQPDFPTPAHVVEAACKALRDGHHGYTPANGLPQLREAVAADLEARSGVRVDPDCVVIVPGGKVTIFFACLMFGEPGAEIVHPDPGFPIYESAIRFAGAEPVALPLSADDGFGVSADALLDRVTPRTRLIVLNAPSNPTGGVIDPNALDRLAEGLAAFPQVAILSDEIYSRLLYDGRTHHSLLAHPGLRDRTILLDGWSKTHAMTGWRLGFGVWPQPLVDGAVRLAINSHSCVNASAQFAGLAALQGPQDHVETMRAAFDRRRRTLVDALNALPGVACPEPGGAFYAFPDVSGTGFDAKTLERRLLEEAGVATIAGTSFGRHGAGHLRLSYATSEADLAAAVDRIGAWLDGARFD
jgi:aspartate/methionine/tyrosine aminotransferase